MSYQTHNLRDGDVFSAPTDLEAYADYRAGDAPYHLFEVLDVESASLRDGRYPDHRGRLDKYGCYMQLVARCLACGEMLNAVVSQNISLCMIAYGPDEDGEPGYLEGPYEDGVTTIEEAARRWRCER